MSLRGGRLKALLGFWAGQVGESPPVLALPLDFPRPPAQTFAGDNVQLQLGAELLARLNAVAQRRHTTLFAVLLTAYDVLLYQVTGQRRIILGTSVAGRSQRDLEPLIGFFVNTLPLSTEIDPRLPFDELLCAVQQNLLAAFEHQELPFDLLVQHLRIERNPAVTPIFQGRFVFNDFAYGETLAAGAKAAGLRIAGTFEESIGAKFDLSAMLRAEGDRITCNLEFRPDLFKRATIERLGRQYLGLLGQVAASPERLVGRLDVSDESAREEQRSRQEERKQSALSLLKKSRPAGLAREAGPAPDRT
jgi:non-ribosomal peptide synthetase component F